MNDLVAWLRAQLDEDERLAPFGAPAWSVTGRRNVADDNGDTVAMAADRAEADHIARWDPARVLREVEAKRRIIELHPLVTYTDEEPGYRQILNDHTCPGRQAPCTTLRLLALPYADRPGYRQEWAP